MRLDSKSQPLISIIIPVYNGKVYISNCLKSIEQQEYADLEIIFVDDGSNDDSREVIEQYRQKYKMIMDIILICQENQGQGVARNTGIKHANGKYITFLDQDDTLEHGILIKMLKTAQEENADIVECGYRRVAACGKIKKEVRLQQYEWSKYKIIAPWSKLYRTEFIKKNQVYFLPVVLGEDIYFLMQAYSYMPKIAFLNDIGYNWMDNEASVSNTAHRELTRETSLLQLFDMLEKLSQIEILKKDRMYEYFLLKTAIWDILYTGRNNQYKTVRENSERIWSWFASHFKDYMKNPYLKFDRPRGEAAGIRLLVWLYIKIKRLGMEKYLLYIISRLGRKDVKA